MEDCKPKDRPMITRQAKKKSPLNEFNGVTKPTNALYRAVIGSLLYLAQVTRPDISYAISKLARNQVNPTEDDWEDVKRVFKYLKGTKNLGITYHGKNDVMEATTDASFIDCEDSKSTGGYVIKLFGDSVAWKSHKQNTVSKSTCEAEYIAMSEASAEIVNLDKAIRDIIDKTMYPVTIWTDNRSARDCTEMDGSHRLKNFDYSLEEIQSRLKKEKKPVRKEICHLLTEVSLNYALWKEK